MKLSIQEKKVLAFLLSKKEVFWEELVQFCKDPTTVKLKTVQKIVSNIKKKFKENNLPSPFNCKISSMHSVHDSPASKLIPTNKIIDFNGQKLVQVQRITRNSNINPTSAPSRTSTPTLIENHNAITKSQTCNKEITFLIRNYARQVVTNSGIYTLNCDEFEIFNYILNNKGRFISLEELRDKVCFPKYGSKLPARWFFSIQRRISNIRHQIPETRDKLLTAKQQNTTGYILN